MSSYLDGMANINNLTAKIEALKKQAPAPGASNARIKAEVDKTLVGLQQDFNQMLNDLTTVTDDNETEKKKSDPFAFLTQSDQAAVAASGQTTVGTTSNTNASQTVDPNILATQYKLNLDNIF